MLELTDLAVVKHIQNQFQDRDPTVVWAPNELVLPILAKNAEESEEKIPLLGIGVFRSSWRFDESRANMPAAHSAVGQSYRYSPDSANTPDALIRGIVRVPIIATYDITVATYKLIELNELERDLFFLDKYKILEFEFSIPDDPENTLSASLVYDLEDPIFSYTTNDHDAKLTEYFTLRQMQVRTWAIRGNSVRTVLSIINRFYDGFTSNEQQSTQIDKDWTLSVNGSGS